MGRWTAPRTARSVTFVGFLAVGYKLSMAYRNPSLAVLVAMPGILVSWICILAWSMRVGPAAMREEDFRRRDQGDPSWTHCHDCGAVAFPTKCYADPNPFNWRDRPCHPAWREKREEGSDD